MGTADRAESMETRVLRGLEEATRDGRADVTFYFDQHRDTDLADLWRLSERDAQGLGGSFDIELGAGQLHSLPPVRSGKKVKKAQFARLQISSVRKRQAWSVTARIKYVPYDGPIVESSGTSPSPEAHAPLLTGWLQEYPIAADLRNSEYLTSFGMTCKVLADVFSLRPNDSGLILVSGQTGSGKSEVLRGVMHLYLEQLVAAQKTRAPSERRNPHVLTFEDPIEASLFKTQEVPACFTACGIDYTPRVKAVDAQDLGEVVSNALRQKPALLFVGEIRDDSDIERCLEFAGTGHLVFATTHAGSLLEGVQRALNACEAHDPGTRAIWVPKIRAVVHLKNFSFECRELPGGIKKVLLPSVYVNSALAQHALVSDGLAALLPCSPLGKPDVKGALGRRYFVRKFCEETQLLIVHADAALDELQRQLGEERNRDCPQESVVDVLKKQISEWTEFLQLSPLLTAEWKRNVSAEVVSGTANLEAIAISADLNGE